MMKVSRQAFSAFSHEKHNKRSLRTVDIQVLLGDECALSKPRERKGSLIKCFHVFPSNSFFQRILLHVHGGKFYF